MSASFLTARALERSATRRIASSSVAPVASGYARSPRPRPARVSTVECAICAKGGLP